MPSFNTPSYYQGTIFVNYKNLGWSESLDIFEATDAAAQATLLKYARHRAWMLPASCKIVYGRVCLMPLERYSIALIDMPLTGKAGDLTTPNANPVNDAMVSPCFHMIADEGKRSIRFLRGVPDDIIADLAIVPAPPAASWMDLVTDPGDGVSNPGTYAAAMKLALSFIGQKTFVASRLQVLDIGGFQLEGYRLRIFTGILSREARAKKTGRPFGLHRGRAAIAG